MGGSLHTTPGRLRVKVADVKGSPARAAQVERRLTLLRGVDQAYANPVTGSVLVLYDAARTDARHVIDALRAWGHPCLDPAPPAPERSPDLAITVLRAMAEFALQRLITTLV